MLVIIFRGGSGGGGVLEGQDPFGGHTNFIKRGKRCVCVNARARNVSLFMKVAPPPQKKKEK